MGPRGLLFWLALCVVLVKIYSINVLETMEDLKKLTNFGKNFPQQGLALLCWLLSQGKFDQNGKLRLNFNPAGRHFGIHEYKNYEFTFPSLSNTDFLYYTFGNLNNAYNQLPNDITWPFCKSRGHPKCNVDRIVIQIKKNDPTVVDKVYITQHSKNTGSAYDKDLTYLIDEELLELILELCRPDGDSRNRKHDDYDHHRDRQRFQRIQSMFPNAPYLHMFLYLAGYNPPDNVNQRAEYNCREFHDSEIKMEHTVAWETVEKSHPSFTFNNLLSLVISPFSNLFSLVFLIFSNVFSLVYFIVNSLFSLVYFIVSSLFSLVYFIVNSLFSLVYFIVGSLFSLVYVIVSNLFSLVYNTVSNLLSLIYNTVSNLLSLVYGTVSNETVYESPEFDDSEIETEHTVAWETVEKSHPSFTFNNLLSLVISPFSNLFSLVFLIFSNVFSLVYFIVNSLFSLVYFTVNSLFSLVYFIVSSLFSLVYVIVSNLLSLVYSTVSNLLSLVYSTVSNLLSLVYNTVSNLLSLVYSTVSNETVYESPEFDDSEIETEHTVAWETVEKSHPSFTFNNLLSLVISPFSNLFSLVFLIFSNVFSLVYFIVNSLFLLVYFTVNSLFSLVYFIVNSLFSLVYVIVSNLLSLVYSTVSNLLSLVYSTVSNFLSLVYSTVSNETVYESPEFDDSEIETEHTVAWETVEKSHPSFTFSNLFSLVISPFSNLFSLVFLIFSNVFSLVYFIVSSLFSLVYFIVSNLLSLVYSTVSNVFSLLFFICQEIVFALGKLISLVFSALVNLVTLLITALLIEIVRRVIADVNDNRPRAAPPIVVVSHGRPGF